jgi:superfamily II DNA or RNA helicase
MRRQVQARIIKAFIDSQEIRVLLGTTILGEGIDLPTVDALVYARGEKAEVSLTQSIYRTCTAVEGKTHAVVVDFADRHNRKLLKHSQERLEVYYKEPIFEVDILEDVGQFNHWLSQVSFSQTCCAGEPK